MSLLQCDYQYVCLKKEFALSILLAFEYAKKMIASYSVFAGKRQISHLTRSFGTRSFGRVICKFTIIDRGFSSIVI